jgi:hypothetical protein
MTSTYPPRYDERFVNFGKNKAQQAFEMTALGYRMMVLPGVYIGTAYFSGNKTADCGLT